MRTLINKRNFTKSERKFIRFLQENHIPFQTKLKIKGREIDFLIGKYAVDLDCHDQDSSKNVMLVEEGFIPLHFSNREIKNNDYKIQKWDFGNT